MTTLKKITCPVVLSNGTFDEETIDEHWEYFKRPIRIKHTLKVPFNLDDTTVSFEEEIFERILMAFSVRTKNGYRLSEVALFVSENFNPSVPKENRKKFLMNHLKDIAAPWIFSYAKRSEEIK